MNETDEEDFSLRELYNIDGGKDSKKEKPVFYDSISLAMFKFIEHFERMYRDSDKEKENVLGFEYEDFQKGSLIVLASRPTIGKTAFVLSLLKKLSVDSDIPTGLVLPGTMDFTILGQRLISMSSDISLAKIRGCIVDYDEVKKIQEVANDLYNKPLYIINEPNCSLGYLLSAAKVLVKEEKIKLLVIDGFEYLLDIIDAEKDEYRFMLNNTIDELKKLAEELKIPVIITVSLSSGNENTELTIQEFKKYLVIPQKADKVMFIHRERIVDPEIHTEQAKLIIAKNEFGSTRDIQLKFDKKTQLFTENN